jgi:serine protease Do
LPSIADVVEQVFPSVVAITTETATLDFFNRPRTQEGAGSGWIIDSDGIIVTNNHVVENAEKVTVELSDGRTFQAGPDDVFRDPVADLAIVKINARNLPAANLGNSKSLRVGEWVIAIGNALGEGISAKEGTVSRLNVSLTVDQGQTLFDLVETSAAINPGNSGGPLVNMAGEVIGINSIKIATVSIEGIGYAISTQTAVPIIEELINRGYVVRPWLGIAPVTVDQSIAVANGLSVDKGVVIAYILAGGPADKAGLRELDVITHFNGEEVVAAEDLVQAIRSAKAGDTVTITFVRGDETMTTTAVLENSPPPSN